MVTTALRRVLAAALLSLACAACSGSTDKFACNDASNCPDGWYCGSDHVCVNPGVAPTATVQLQAPAAALHGTVRLTATVNANVPVQTAQLVAVTAAVTKKFAAVTPIAPPTYLFDVDTTQLPAGAVQLSVAVTLSTGDVVTSAPQAATVDNAAPVLSISTAPSPAVRAGVQVTVSVTSSKALASIGGTASVGAQSLGSLSVLSGAAGDSAFTLGLTVPSSAPAGTLLLSLTGTDAAGIASAALTASTTIYGAFTVTSLTATSASTRTLSGVQVPAGNADAPIDVTVKLPVAVPLTGPDSAVFSLTDALSHTRNLHGSVTVAHDASSTTLTVADSIAASDADGTAQLKVTVTDLAGNVATLTAPLVIDNLAPALGALSPSLAIADASTALVNVTGTANKAIVAASFSAFNGTTTVTGACTCDGGSCAVSTSAAPLVVCAVAVPAVSAPQTVAVTVSMHDSIGNVSLDSASSNKASFQAVPLPAAMSLSASVASVTLGSSLTLTPVFSNGAGVISNDRDLNVLSPLTSNIPVTVSPGGTTTYTLTVRNAAGSSSSATAHVSVVPLAGALSVAYVAPNGTTTPGAMTAGTQTGTLSFGLPDLSGFATAALVDGLLRPLKNQSDGSAVTSQQLIAASSSILGGIAIPSTLASDSATLVYSLQLTVSGGGTSTKTANLQVLPQVTLTGQALKLAPATIASGSIDPLTLSLPIISASAQLVSLKDQNGNTLVKVGGGQLGTADLVAASGGTLQVLPPPSMPIDAPVTYNYTLLASNAANSATASTALRIGPLPLFTGALDLAPAVVTGGGATTLTATLPAVTGGVTYSLTDGAGAAARDALGNVYSTSQLQGLLGSTLQLQGPATSGTAAAQSLTYTFTASNGIGATTATATLSVVPPPRFDATVFAIAPATITSGTTPLLTFKLPGNGSVGGATVAPALTVSAGGPSTPVLKHDGNPVAAADLGGNVSVDSPATASGDSKTFTYTLTFANGATTPAVATTTATLTTVPAPAFGSGTFAPSPASISGGSTTPVTLTLPAMTGAATATLTEDSTGAQLPVRLSPGGAVAGPGDIIGAAAGTLTLAPPTTAPGDNRNVTYQLTISNAAVPPQSVSLTAQLPVLQVPVLGAGFSVSPRAITAGVESALALTLPTFTGGATVSITDQNGAAIADLNGATYTSQTLLAKQGQVLPVKPPAAAGSYTYTCSLTNAAAAGQQRSATATTSLSVLPAPVVAARFVTSPTGITGGTTPAIALAIPTLTNAASATLTEDSTGAQVPVVVSPGNTQATSQQILTAAAAGTPLLVRAPTTVATDNKTVTYTLTVANGATTPTTSTSSAFLSVYPLPTIQGTLSVAPAVVTVGVEQTIVFSLPSLNGGPGSPSATLVDPSSGNPISDANGAAFTSQAILNASSGTLSTRPPGAAGTYSVLLTLTNGAPVGQRGSVSISSSTLTVLAPPAVAPTFPIAPAAVTGGSSGYTLSLAIPAFTTVTSATLTDGAGNPARDPLGNVIGSGAIVAASGKPLVLQAPVTAPTDNKVLTYTLTVFNGATTPTSATSVGHLSVVPPPTLSGALSAAPAVITLGVEPKVTLALPSFSVGPGGTATLLDDANNPVLDPIGGAIGPSTIVLAAGGPLDVKAPTASTHYTLTVSNAAGSQLASTTAQPITVVLPPTVNSITFATVPTGVSGGTASTIALNLPSIGNASAVLLEDDSSGARQTTLLSTTGKAIVLGSDIPLTGGPVTVVPPTTAPGDNKTVHYFFSVLNNATTPAVASSSASLTVFPKPVLTGSLTAAPAILTVGVETQLTLTLPAVSAVPGGATATLTDGSGTPVTDPSGTTYLSGQILGAASLPVRAPTGNTTYTLTVTNGAPSGQRVSTAVTSAAVTLLPRPTVGAPTFAIGPASISGGSTADLTLGFPAVTGAVSVTLTEDSAGTPQPAKRSSDGANATLTDVLSGTLKVKAPATATTDTKLVHYALTVFNGATSPASATSTGTVQIIAQPTIASFAITPATITGGATGAVTASFGAIVSAGNATLTEDSTGTPRNVLLSPSGLVAGPANLLGASGSTLALQAPSTVATDNKTVTYVLTLSNNATTPASLVVTAQLGVVQVPAFSGLAFAFLPNAVTVGVEPSVKIQVPTLTGATTASIVDAGNNPVRNPATGLPFTAAAILGAAGTNSVLSLAPPATAGTASYSLKLANSVGGPASVSATLAVLAAPTLTGALTTAPTGITGANFPTITLNLPQPNASVATATLTEDSTGSAQPVLRASDGLAATTQDIVTALTGTRTLAVRAPTSNAATSKSVNYVLTVFNGAATPQSATSSGALTIFPVPGFGGQSFTATLSAITVGVDALSLNLPTLNGGPGASATITASTGVTVTDPAGVALTSPGIFARQGTTLAIKPPNSATTYTLTLTNGAPIGQSSFVQAVSQTVSVYPPPSMSSSTFTTTPASITGGSTSTVKLTIPTFSGFFSGTLTENSTGTAQPVLFPGGAAVTLTDLANALGNGNQLTVKAPTTISTDSKIVTYTLTGKNAATNPITVTSTAQLTVFPAPTISGSLTVSPLSVSADVESSITFTLPTLNGGPGTPTVTLIEQSTGAVAPPGSGTPYSSAQIYAQSGKTLAVNPPSLPGTYNYTLALSNGAAVPATVSLAPVSLTVYAAPSLTGSIQFPNLYLTGGTTANQNLLIPAFTGATGMTLTEDSTGSAVAVKRGSDGLPVAFTDLQAAQGGGLVVKAPTSVASTNRLVIYTLLLKNSAATPATFLSTATMQITPALALSSASLTFPGGSTVNGGTTTAQVLLPAVTQGTAQPFDLSVSDGVTTTHYVQKQAPCSTAPCALVAADLGTVVTLALPTTLLSDSKTFTFTLLAKNLAGDAVTPSPTGALTVKPAPQLSSPTFSVSPNGVTGGYSSSLLITMALPSLAYASPAPTVTFTVNGAAATKSDGTALTAADLGSTITVVPPSGTVRLSSQDFTYTVTTVSAATTSIASGVFSVGGRFAAGPALVNSNNGVVAINLPNGKVLLATTVDLELYDPAGNSGAGSMTVIPTGTVTPDWTSMSPLLLANGKVLFTASNSFGAPPSYLYDTFAGTLTAGAAGNLVSFPSGVVLPNGKAIYFGGSSIVPGSVGNASNSVYSFDPTTNAYANLATLSVARKFAAVAVVPSGKVVVAGGQDSLGNAITSVEAYDPYANSGAGTTAVVAAPLPAGHFRPEATRLGNGKILIDDQILDPTNTGQFTAAPSGVSPPLAWTSPHSPVLLSGNQVLYQGDSQSGPIPQLYDVAANGFVITGPLQALSSVNGTALMGNGKVFLAQKSGTFIYTPSNNGGSGSFSPTISLTSTGSPRTGPTSAVLANGTVFSSQNTGGTVYDPATNAFTAYSSLSNHRYQNAALLYNGKLLLVGGTAGAILSSSPISGGPTLIFDPVSATFIAPGTLPGTVRYNMASATLTNGSVLLAGGALDNTTQHPATNLSDLYDPVAGTFSSTGPMSAARSAAMAIRLPNGKVLVAGGNSGTFSSPFAVVNAEVYDPAAGTFSPLSSSLLAPQYSSVAVLLPNGKVLITAGQPASADAEIFDPQTGSFTATAPLPSATLCSSGPCVGNLLPNGKVLVVGPVNQAYVYDPGTGTWGPVIAAPASSTLATAPLYTGLTQLCDFTALTSSLFDPYGR